MNSITPRCFMKKERKMFYFCMDLYCHLYPFISVYLYIILSIYQSYVLILKHVNTSPSEYTHTPPPYGDDFHWKDEPRNCAKPRRHHYLQ